MIREKSIFHNLAEKKKVFFDHCGYIPQEDGAEEVVGLQLLLLFLFPHPEHACVHLFV